MSVGRQRLFEILRNHVAGPWFPRCIDEEQGGFLSGFDASWKAVGKQPKQLQFQARQTLAAAELLACFPDDEAFRRAVDAGWSYLGGALWDRDAGGWFAMLDRGGQPLLDGLKHTHGIAYAIEACFAVAALGIPEAMALGEEGLRWLHRHAHDGGSGGYWGPLERSGQVIREGRGRQQTDLIGTPFGTKDMNVNKDLFIAWSYAMKVTDSDFVRERYEDALDYLLRYLGRVDFPAFYIDERGDPVGDYWRPSECVQTAGSLIEARSNGVKPAELTSLASRLFQRSLAEGWNDKVGALIYGAMPEFG